MNVYDFDGTIYNGDSTIDFYIFCLLHNFRIIKCLPHQIKFFILYKLHLCNKKKFKEEFFCFLKALDDIELIIDCFWKQNFSKIKKWYLKNKKNSDVIISASPEFLLIKLKPILNINCIIGSIVDKNTGCFISENCYGYEKVKRFKILFKDSIPEEFYTDSKSDLPMVNFSKKAFFVHGDDLYEV